MRWFQVPKVLSTDEYVSEAGSSVSTQTQDVILLFRKASRYLTAADADGIDGKAKVRDNETLCTDVLFMVKREVAIAGVMAPGSF